MIASVDRPEQNNFTPSAASCQLAVACAILASMDISFSTPESNFHLIHGYAVAGQGIVTSLQALGHRLPYRDKDCRVEINLGQPDYWVWSSNLSYKIGIVAWESSVFPDGWVLKINSILDELWTPSPLIAQWFKTAGVQVPIYVYEHGVDSDVWTPKKRVRKDILKFIHIGEPAPRKGGKMALAAFLEAFGDREDVQLTIKAAGINTALGPNNQHPYLLYKNVKVNKAIVEEHLLVDLVRRHDIMVYNSYGDGFGLIPLQAMSTGMPTICTSAWAPYEQFLIDELKLRSNLINSPWQSMHPGQVFEPEFDHLVELYLYCDQNFRALANQAFALAPAVHKYYDWNRLTKNVMKHLEEKDFQTWFETRFAVQ